MYLKLKSNGSAAPLADYLKKFEKIRKSLLLEIDPIAESFVAKIFSEDRSLVRASVLSFSDANFEIEKHDGTTNGQRIKFAIVVNLSKLIKIIERFGSNFTLTFNYDVLNGDVVDYVCQNVVFQSSVLKMKMDGSRTSEFQYLSDDLFNNKIFKVTDSLSVPLTADCLQSITKISEIASIDPKKDILIFYVNDNQELYVKDSTGYNDDGTDKPSNFEFKIADMPDVFGYPVRLPISREKFVQVVSGTDEDFDFIIGKDVQGNLTRILFNSLNTNSKIVISTINEN